MGIIYKEIVRRKKVSFVRIFMLVVLFLLTANVLYNSANYSDWLNVQLGFILLVDGLLFMYMLKIVFEIAYLHRICYTYKLIDRELIIEKLIGSSKRVILSINTKDIEMLVPAKDANKNGAKGIERTYKFTCGSLSNRAYCCVVNNKGKRIKFYFQPSDEFIKKVNTIIKKEPI